MSIEALKEKKNKKQKISMVTCYEAWSAHILKDTPIDMLLVGDSLAMVLYGHDSTLPADMDTMVRHTEAVSRCADKKFVVADMPFMSLHKGFVVAMHNIERFMQAGANAVKIEGVLGNERVIEKAQQAGVPIMGHLGLTPQSIHQLGGFKVQGQTPDARQTLIKQAKLLEDLGCFAIVLECIPYNLAEQITHALKIPTIGIGAGPNVDGQVLVLHDLLGMHKDFKPKFLKTYLNGHDLISKAVCQFDKEVKNKKYPTKKESYP